ncbi:MAG: tetratricopeptide repeat protein [Caldisericia bacterium]
MQKQLQDEVADELEKEQEYDAVESGITELYCCNMEYAYKSTNPNEKIKFYTAAIKTCPTSSTAYCGRGRIYTSQKKYVKAIADFTNSIELDPEFAPAYYYRGLAYSIIKLNDNSIKDFTKAILLTSNSKYWPNSESWIDEYTFPLISAYAQRGFAYYRKSLYREAMDDFNKAIKLTPGTAFEYYIRGLLFARRQAKDLAIKDLKKASELDYIPAKKILKKLFNIKY